MKKILLSICTTAVFAGLSLAQTSTQVQGSSSVSQDSSASVNRSGAQLQSQSSASAAAQGAVSGHDAQAAGSGQLATGTSFHTTLEKPLDARKCKPGDQVVARSTQNVKSHGEVVIPKGSKIIGHVTEVRARGKGQSQSSVGIAFDRALLKGGREVPVSASIEAIAMSQQNASSELMGDSMDDGAMADGGVMATGSAPRGGLIGGATGAVGATGGSLVRTAGGVAGGVAGEAGATANGAGAALNASGELNTSSRGVVGLRGLSLNSAVASSAQGSVISSNSQNVHLESGTQMILQVNAH
jgi:hypothetical protein